MASLPEPWLRGPLAGVHPLLAPLFHTFQQTREELAQVTEGLTPQQLWTGPGGAASIGFHIRHAGGAATRLATYLDGRQLSPQQLDRMRAEAEPGASREQLLADLERDLATVEALVRALDPAHLADARAVGRKLLPTTVIGLVTHITEHTLRHTGQAATTARWVRSLPGAASA